MRNIRLSGRGWGPLSGARPPSYSLRRDGRVKDASGAAERAQLLEVAGAVLADLWCAERLAKPQTAAPWGARIGGTPELCCVTRGVPMRLSGGSVASWGSCPRQAAHGAALLGGSELGRRRAGRQAGGDPGAAWGGGGSSDPTAPQPGQPERGRRRQRRPGHRCRRDGRCAPISAAPGATAAAMAAGAAGHAQGSSGVGGPGVVRRFRRRIERRPGGLCPQGQRKAAATPPAAQRARGASAPLAHGPGGMRRACRQAARA